MKSDTHRRQNDARKPSSHKADRMRTPEVQLRAFQPQQFTYTLLELELPQMLAPDLPSNCSLQMGLSTAHCNYQTLRARYCYILSLPLPSGNWVICAPAAFLRCGSRLSGSLSGVEPSFPVTRYDHGRPRANRLVDRAEIHFARRRCRRRETVIQHESPKRSVKSRLPRQANCISRRIPAIIQFECSQSRFSLR